MSTEVGKDEINIDAIWPIGAIYITTVATNPATYFGGTWAAYAEGRVLVGKAATGTFNTAGGTMGAETHTLTTTEMPSHTHTNTLQVNANAGNVAAGAANLDDFPGSDGPISATNVRVGNMTGTINNTGGGAAHNNIQPSIVVYMWTRTA